MSIRQTNQDKTIRYISAIRCLMLGQIQAAKRAFDALYQSQKIDSEGHFLYGVIYTAKGQSDRGLSHLNQASDKLTHAHVKAAIFLAEIRKPSAAGIAYQEALKLSGEDTTPIKSYLLKRWNSAVYQDGPYRFIAERLADLGVPVAVPHAPLLSYGH